MRQNKSSQQSNASLSSPYEGIVVFCPSYVRRPILVRDLAEEEVKE